MPHPNQMQPMNVQPQGQGQAMGQQAPQQAPPPQVMQAIQAKMQDPKFSAWFNSLPPEEKQQALQRLSMDYQGQGGVVDEQMAMAQELRNTETPQGQMAGGAYLAPSVLQHAATGVAKYKGKQQYDEALARKRELSDMQSQGLQDVMASQLRSGSDGY